MEFFMFKMMFDDKTIVNPVNTEEVFTCKDLVDDYKICRKERRMQTNKKAQARHCFDYRTLAYSCYWNTEDDFVELLIKKYEEKQRLIEFLEQEGSVLAPSYKNKNEIFKIRNETGQEMQ